MEISWKLRFYATNVVLFEQKKQNKKQKAEYAFNALVIQFFSIEVLQEFFFFC